MLSDFVTPYKKRAHNLSFRAILLPDSNVPTFGGIHTVYPTLSQSPDISVFILFNIQCSTQRVVRYHRRKCNFYGYLGASKHSFNINRPYNTHTHMGSIPHRIYNVQSTLVISITHVPTSRLQLEQRNSGLRITGIGYLSAHVGIQLK